MGHLYICDARPAGTDVVGPYAFFVHSTGSADLILQRIDLAWLNNVDSSPDVLSVAIARLEGPPPTDLEDMTFSFPAQAMHDEAPSTTIEWRGAPVESRGSDSGGMCRQWMWRVNDNNNHSPLDFTALGGFRVRAGNHFRIAIGHQSVNVENFGLSLFIEE